MENVSNPKGAEDQPHDPFDPENLRIGDIAESWGSAG
jgi:hypothetical protein